LKNITLILLFALSGCTQLNSLAVEEGDNAMACVKGNSSATGGIFGGAVSGITVELPSTVDTSGWTADEWKSLAEVCD
jgi:hypothetical protein|tara:strand:- start:5 stop:238 length:234 start_codon:yes stop_codon:yes gene_type:complete